MLSSLADGSKMERQAQHGTVLEFNSWVEFHDAGFSFPREQFLVDYSFEILQPRSLLPYPLWPSSRWFCGSHSLSLFVVPVHEGCGVRGSVVPLHEGCEGGDDC